MVIDSSPTANPLAESHAMIEKKWRAVRPRNWGTFRGFPFFKSADKDQTLNR